MTRHWLTIFDVPAVICRDQGSQFVGAWFRTMCKHMGIRHAKTAAYHSRWNGQAVVAGRQTFEKLRQWPPPGMGHTTTSFLLPPASCSGNMLNPKVSTNIAHNKSNSYS